jgi:hypothetical protein
VRAYAIVDRPSNPDEPLGDVTLVRHETIAHEAGSGGLGEAAAPRLASAWCAARMLDVARVYGVKL